jgi:hypothetical protein
LKGSEYQLLLGLAILLHLQVLEEDFAEELRSPVGAHLGQYGNLVGLRGLNYRHELTVAKASALEGEVRF